MKKNDKLSGILGIANRAKKIVYGETAFKAIANKNSHLLLISDEASKRTTEKLINRCIYYKKNYLIIDNEVLNKATGNQNTKYLLINDIGFSKSILDICRERWRYG